MRFPWLAVLGLIGLSSFAQAEDFKTFVPAQTTATAPGATDYVPLVQGGATHKIPGTSLLYAVDGLAATFRTNLGLGGFAVLTPGTLTNTDWCTSNGTTISCTQPAPVIPAAANPTATAGAAAVNGSAQTFMRSDAAPPVAKGSAGTFGIVEVDGTTITGAAGVISAAATIINGTTCTPGGSCSPSGGAGTFVSVADANCGTLTSANANGGVQFTTAFSTARSCALPAASAFAQGQTITFVDLGSAVNGANTMTINRAGSDTILGGTSVVLNTPGGASVTLQSDHVSKWGVPSNVGIPSPGASQILASTAGSAAAWGTALPNGITATTQSAADNSTKVATTAYADAGVAALLATNNAFTKGQAGTPVALTDASTIAVDASLGNNFTVTLGGSRTLGNPTNLKAGQVLNFWFTQDGSGSRVLTYSSDYQAAGSVSTLVLSTAAAAVDLVSCVSNTTSTLTCALSKAVAH